MTAVLAADAPRDEFADPRGRMAVWCAFLVAMFAWGFAFYGPPIFLKAVVSRTHWPVTLVSAAVTFHYLSGAAVVLVLPRVHARWGLAGVSASGCFALVGGVLGWAAAREPWQLFAAAAVSGTGWACLGAAGINAIVSRWFTHDRPVALARAYNGASIGGVLFSPLWSVAIERVGFLLAACLLGLLMLAVVLAICATVLRRQPQPGGAGPDARAGGRRPADEGARPAQVGWADPRFLSLTIALTCGLVAQIGVLTHLYSILYPRLGPQGAGWTMAAATLCAVAGRSLASWRMRVQPDRRVIAAQFYLLQLCGCFCVAALLDAGVVACAGVLLFGLGIGNALSLPPLIAQAEFAIDAVPRVVARFVGVSQGFYAFAPAAFAWFLKGKGGVWGFMGVAMALQATAAALLVATRRR